MAAVGGEVEKKQDMQDSEVVAEVEVCKKKQNGKVIAASKYEVLLKKPGICGSTNIAQGKN